MTKEQLRMQMLAGIITESQYKAKLLNELQYFHNGAEMNQTINYDNSDITDDLEALGQGSMDGQDFTPGKTYNIGGQKYKIEAQGDEFKLVSTEALDKYFNGRDLMQYTGVTSFETCDEDDWDKVKDYVEKDKERFLEQNPGVTEAEFNEYMENWINNIEETREMENMNQQDRNF